MAVIDRVGAFFVAAVGAAVMVSAADADEVKLLSAFVLKPAIAELAPEFERASGHTLAITYESAGIVRDRIQNGEAADVAIIQKPAVAALAQQGKILAGTAVTLARSGVGVAVPAGKPRPHISSGAAPQRAPPAATAVPYSGPQARHPRRLP